ncbi:unnamed protein product, partial [Laminaria digitata]
SSPKPVFTQVVSVDVLTVRSAPYYWHFFTVGKIATQQQITGAMAVRLKSSVFWLCRVRLLLFLHVPRQLARASLALVAPSYHTLRRKYLENTRTEAVPTAVSNMSISWLAQA